MRFKNLTSLSLAAAITASTGINSAFAAPDSVYINGNVITVDDQFSIATGFAIEEGRFTAVGGSEQMRDLADENTQLVDLNGQTVIPGLIDNHNHFIRGASHWGHLLRLDGIESRAEALRRMQEHAETLPKDEWFLVLGGWHEEQFRDDPRGFTREELDLIAGDRPAFLQATYSHAFVNSAFLKHIGAELKTTADSEKAASNEVLDAKFGPPLTELVERTEDGVATSRLNGGMGMVLQVSTVMPSQTDDEVRTGVLAAQQYFNSIGLTSIYDPGGALVSQQAVDVVTAVNADKQLSLRTFRTVSLGGVTSDVVSKALKLRSLPDWLAKPIMNFVTDVESTSEGVETVNQLPALFTGDDFNDSLAIGEVLYVPLHDSLGHEHQYEVTPHRKEEVRKLLESIVSRGLAAQIHAVNAATLNAYLDIIEDLSREYSLYPGQMTFTHAEGVNESILRRIQDLNINLQIRSATVVRSRDGLTESYGEIALLTPPLRMIQNSGVKWGLGTDGTKASQINPLRTLHWATTGRSINGEQVLAENQLITREEALIAHTRSNAALVNRANLLGQIHPGYLADFVVLDKDYMTVDLEDIKSITVERTVVNGDVVYQRAQ